MSKELQNKEMALAVMRYSFPCADISVQLGTITREEYEKIEAALLKQEPLSRAELERFFPALSRRLQEVAVKEGLQNYWLLDVLHTYFLKYHDEYINKGDGMLGLMPPAEKELCRCRLGKITELLGNDVVLVQMLENKTELRVFARYLPDVKKGAIVAIHRRFLTEQLSPETAAAFARPQK